MNAAKWTGGLLGVLALLAGAAPGGPAKLASSPEEAVRYTLAAMQQGDVPALLAQLAAPSRAIFEGMMTFQLAREDVDRALAEKFGRDSKQPTAPTLRDHLKHTKDIRIVSKDDKDKDKVVLTVWLTEERDKERRTLESTWYAVKDADAWRLRVPYNGGRTRLVSKKGPEGKETAVHVFEREGRTELSGREADYLRTAGPKYKAAMEQLAKEIRGGQFKDRAAADKALQRAEERFRQENPLPVLDKGER
jgi:hypothetical protein